MLSEIFLSYIQRLVATKSGKTKKKKTKVRKNGGFEKYQEKSGNFI